MIEYECTHCGPLLETDVVWVVDHRETRETPEEGHNQCCFCGREVQENED